MLYKRGVLKNYSKFTDKHKTQSSAGARLKNVLKNFAKFTEKKSLSESLFSKDGGWKPEAPRSSHWRSFVKK